MWYRLLAFDIEQKGHEWLHRHRSHFLLFFFLYLVVLLAYGEKLVYYLLPSDDYMRFWGDHNTKMLITHSARWAHAWLNDYLLIGHLQALPYINSLFGILLITAMAYMSTYYWKSKKRGEVAVATLLIAVTPMFAHNLYFSSNLAIWMAMAVGMVGALLLLSRRWLLFFLGVGFLVVAIGAYQVVIQIVLLLVLFRFLFSLVAVEGIDQLRALLFEVIKVTIGVVIAYGLSNQLNHAILLFHHWHEAHRLVKAEHHLSLLYWMGQIKQCYTHYATLLYLKKPIRYAYLLFVGVAIVVYLLSLVRRSVSIYFKMALIGMAILAILIVPIVMHLPYLLGLSVPMRAHLSYGWVLGGFFLLWVRFSHAFFKSLAYLLAFIILILHIYYIALFFDAGMRQTQMDVIRANQIVQRIRSSGSYQYDPIGFYIIGQKKFNVDGWDVLWQQPLNSFWAKYNIFKYFTDLKFYVLPPAEHQKLIHHLIAQGRHLHPYPAKDSIFVYQNRAILFLDTDKINILIDKEKLLRQFPHNEQPTIHKGDYDIYLKEGVLYYRKMPCKQNDMQAALILRLFPKDPQKPFYKGARIVPFQNLDFRFWLYGKIEGDQCIAAVRLPDYTIEKIVTGLLSSDRKEVVWEVEYRLSD